MPTTTNSLPETADLCWHLVAGPDQACVVMPGGAAVCVSVPSVTIPSGIEFTRAAFAQLNSALAPLMPALRILDFCLAVLKALQAVPGILWSPGDFITALTAVIKKAQPLLQLVPGMWVFFLVGAVLDLVIRHLQATLSQLDAVIQQQAAILAASTRAAQLGNADLQIVADCATGQLAAIMFDANARMQPLNMLLGVLNLFLSLVPGAPKIPTLASLGTDAEAAIAPLQQAVTELQSLRRWFPF